jgi:predicted metal-dependent phosphoesterase TrpH
VADGKDVHVLAYNLPAAVPALDMLITEQRARRISRAHEIAERLARQGAPIDIDDLVVATSSGGKSVARPQLAERLITAGHAHSIGDAFDRFLGEQCVAYVPHTGASPGEVVAMIVRAGGVASLAHPGYTKRDDILPLLVDAGLSCLEAYHSSHDAATTERYLALASRYGLAVTGGSDFHGDGTRRAEHFGRVTLPRAEYERVGALMAPRH